MKTLTSVDLFAGCGGLSLGLENAGFIPAFVNELDKDAMESYLINREGQFPHLRSRLHHCNDIKQLVLNNEFRADVENRLKSASGIDVKNGDLDLLVGGPPCQGFSGIGHRRSYSVDKEQLPSNHLFEDMAFLIRQWNPKIFVFENVAGLLSSKWNKQGTKGEIWETVLNTFKSIPNYEVDYALVKSKDYGVPQNRPRVLLVGIRDDINSFRIKTATANGFLPTPKTEPFIDLVDLLSDLIDPNYLKGSSSKEYVCDPKNDIQKYFRTHPDGYLMRKGDELTEQVYANHSDSVVERFEYMIAHNGKIPDRLKTKKFAQRLLPKRWGSNGPSITATSLPDDYVHFCQPRIPTVREWARLQGFPDWYQFAGKRTTGGIRRAGNPRDGNFARELPKYTQIGNAVPVKLAEEIGKHFRAIIEAN